MKTNISRVLALAFALWACLAADAQAQTSICPNEPLVLTLTGYTGSIQWQYASSPSGPFGNLPGVTGDSATVTAPLSGWYRAEVISGTCSAFYSDTLELVIFAQPAADAGSDKSICQTAGDSLGGQPSATGGTAPYVYAWTPANDLSSASDANPYANPTQSTIYVLTVTDTNGCISQDSVSVTVNALPLVNAGTDSSIVCSSSLLLNGSATGSGPLTTLWSPAGTLSDPTILNPVATPSGNTNYVLTATDNLGCSASDTVAITVTGASTGSDTLEFSGFIDSTFVVPACAGPITIQVWGAQGGSNTSSVAAGGLGAYQSGEFNLPAGTRLKVIVGQYPGTASNGGGGGTFVTLTDNTPLIIAGGGGGSGGGSDAQTKNGQAGTSGAAGSGGGGAGGTAGSGGFIGASFASGAGGGFYTNGQDGWTAGSGGFAYVNGGAGANVGFGIGGFGGGGNGSGYVVGGGGGGYSGGGAASNSIGGGGVGGGGGSYNSGTNPVSTGGVNLGNGRVIISW